MTVEQVVREVRKDSLFYFISAGGLTLSGGEILAQPEFSLALLKNAKMECFRTAVETSFIAPWEKIQPMLPYIDTAYVDLKVFDPKRHKEYCGISNERILKNLELTNVVEKKFQLVVRTPLIPGVNDSEEELEEIYDQFMQSSVPDCGSCIMWSYCHTTSWAWPPMSGWAGRIYWEMCRLPRRNTWRHAGRSSGNMCKTFDKRSIRR